MRSGVLIPHGHEIISDRIDAIVKHSQNFDVVGQSGNGSDAAQMCNALRPAIVIIDIAVSGLNGIEAITEIPRHMPDTKIVILSPRMSPCSWM